MSPIVAGDGDASRFLGPAQKTHPRLNEFQKMKVSKLLNKTLPHLNQKMFSSNESNGVCFASSLRADRTFDHAKTKVSNNESQFEGRGDGSGGIAGDRKKLKIRGLKNFLEHRGHPPSWVKEFPCRSRYHPDLYLYNFEEGPLNPKRNSEALNHCQFRGGRCTHCGIYTSNLCHTCSHCEEDCHCPNRRQPIENKNPIDLMLNPLGGMPSIESFGTTLSAAQKILGSSQNAPRQYPFRAAVPNSTDSTRSFTQNQVTQAQPQFHPQQLSYLQPTGFQQPYPYAYVPPPLPYMLPPPPPAPVYGYPYPPPPIGIVGYPQAPYPYPQMSPYPPQPSYSYNNQLPGSRFQAPPQYSSSYPEVSTYVSVNNGEPERQ